MLKTTVLVSFATLAMVTLISYENYCYFKRIHDVLTSEKGSGWLNGDGRQRMSRDPEAGQGAWGRWRAESLERMATIFMLCVTSVYFLRNFNHYLFGKDAKQEFEAKLVCIEKRLAHRLQDLEDKIKDFDERYSCTVVETIFSREETLLNDQLLPDTHDACHQIGSEGVGIDQCSQTSRPSTRDGAQQTVELELEVSENGSPRASWYDEVQKEEEFLRRDTCSMDADPQQLYVEEGLPEAGMMTAEPGFGELEDANRSSNYRRIPRYQGAKKVNGKQYHGYAQHAKILDDNASARVGEGMSEGGGGSGRSRPTTPRQYSGADGEFTLGPPNRRRKQRNYNVK